MLTSDALQQMVEQNYETLEGGHHRLRTDIRALDVRIEHLEDAQSKNDVQFTKIATKPVEVAELHFTSSVVLTIVTVCLTIAGGMWASTYGLRSDVRDILTSMAAQVNLEKETSKLNDERTANTARTIDTIDKKIELQRLKLESLTETVLKLQPR
jgi:hypothetical protein